MVWIIVVIIQFAERNRTANNKTRASFFFLADKNSKKFPLWSGQLNNIESWWIFYLFFFLIRRKIMQLLVFDIYGLSTRRKCINSTCFIYSSKVCFSCTRLAIGCTIKTNLGRINKKPWMNKFYTCRRALVRYIFFLFRFFSLVKK